MDLKPRKTPRQARAKATMDAIVEATIQVLQKEGYDRLTTIRVAERAGASVGSLYQYFPNKAALVCAVIDYCCQKSLASFEQSLLIHNCDDLPDAIRRLIDENLVSERLPPDLHRMINDLAPRLGVQNKTLQVSRAMTRMIETVLRRHAEVIAPDTDLVVASTIIQTVLEAIAHRIALVDPKPVADGILAEEATQLVLRYLRYSGSTNGTIASVT